MKGARASGLPRSTVNERLCLHNGHAFLAWQLRCANGRSSRRQQPEEVAAATGKTQAAADKGKDCEYVMMPGGLVQRVVGECVSWLEGLSGELEGVVQSNGICREFSLCLL